MAAHEDSKKLVRISSSKFHHNEMHHLTLFNCRLTNNQFHAKNKSAFERAELQLHSNRMPSQFFLIFPLRAARILQLLKTTPHISVLHEQNLIKFCT